MDADLVKIEEMVMKGEEVTSTEPAVKPQEPYRTIVIPQPPPVMIQPYQHESLQCFQCFITFCNSKAKERHMKKSHREEYKQQLQQCDTLFTCYVCDRTFPSSEELTAHQSTHNKEDKPFKCTHCKESFRTFSELTSHRRQVCPERQFQCKDCGTTFRSPALLRNHRLAVHPVRDPEDPVEVGFHRCPKCNAGFNTEAELLQHQENHAGNQHCNGGPPAKRPRGRPPKTDNAPSGAEKQVKRKKEEEAAEGVKEEAAANSEKQAKPRKKKAEAEEEMKTETEDQTDTGVAAEAESTPATSKVGKVDGGARRGRPPKSAPSAKAEEKKADPRKAHPCGECEESFARPEQLQAHVSRVHTAGRHACPTCGKSFGRESNLKAHQQSHTKEEEEEEDEEDEKKPAGRGKR
ncbi:zinc finger protein 497 [Clupea harengus]|uniref:Zinc finger protein 497 n=1 Tax=Clupea harengus TaxID=7950 RepID=A0A6P3VJ45_CLUHA|nr:zinc finger protein 497 [Clupea harengus]XP_012673608.2 zinc finger protein 497 [Clupea harengus]XP_031431633.1 zinc finger protein 497 [Clupea harengus]